MHTMSCILYTLHFAMLNGNKLLYCERKEYILILSRRKDTTDTTVALVYSSPRYPHPGMPRHGHTVKTHNDSNRPTLGRPSAKVRQQQQPHPTPGGL